jgi:hypothetical protein
MQDPRGAWRTMGEKKMCDLTQVNIQEKMKQLVEEGTTKIGEKIGFQVLQDKENHPRHIFCNFLSWGTQAGTIPEIQQALLDIQAFQRSVKKDAFIELVKAFLKCFRFLYLFFPLVTIYLHRERKEQKG